jgi:hypothetical protein
MCFVQLELGKTECICFLSVISVKESGIICKLIGLRLKIFKVPYLLQEWPLGNRFSWRLLCWHVGTFGSKEMVEFLGMIDHLLLDGEVVSSMIYPCLGIGLKTNIMLN